MITRALAICLTIVTATACLVANSQVGRAAASSPFQPPPGWRHIGQQTGGLGTWLHQGDSGYAQNVSAQSVVFKGKLADLIAQEVTYIKGTFADVSMNPNRQTTVCGKHPATLLSYTFAAANGTTVVGERVLTMYGSTAYSAAYNRGVDQQADAAAEKSLKSLCGGN